jgi:phosphoglycolate phosphatase
MIRKPKAIFLDWDGTLVDSFAFLLTAHNHVRNIFGMPPFTADEFMKYFGMPRDTLYQKLYEKNKLEAKTHFEAFVIQKHLKYLKPLPGADGLVRTIHELGLKSGVVSNKKGEFVRREIEHFGWTPLFSAIVGSGEAPQDKPSPDPLLLALTLSGLEGQADETWYVGDSETDALCAKQAGSPLVLIDHGHNLTGWIGEYKPILIIKNCGELSDFLLQ